MREGNMIRVKCLSEAQPRPDGTQVRANLEDAYLWLMKSKNKKEDKEELEVVEQ